LYRLRTTNTLLAKGHYYLLQNLNTQLVIVANDLLFNVDSIFIAFPLHYFPLIFI